MIARRACFAVVALTAGTLTALADSDYTSEGACRRAESTEYCDKLFPPPPPPKPLHLVACTGMLDEATAMVRKAIIQARFDLMQDVTATTSQSTELMDQAMRCGLDADLKLTTRPQRDDFERAMNDYRSQNAILQAVVSAKRP